MKRKNFLMTITTIFLIFVIVFCHAETVMSQNKIGDTQVRRYYDAMEEEYRANIAEALKERGFANSGVNIRWVSDGDGIRTYTIIIHHSGINMLDNQGREELLKEFAKFEFADKKCSFNYEFLKI